jgi:hypothetical protein
MRTVHRLLVMHAMIRLPSRSKPTGWYTVSSKEILDLPGRADVAMAGKHQ